LRAAPFAKSNARNDTIGQNIGNAPSSALGSYRVLTFRLTTGRAKSGTYDSHLALLTLNGSPIKSRRRSLSGNRPRLLKNIGFVSSNIASTTSHEPLLAG
jgi:hypothetical protein